MTTVGTSEQAVVAGDIIVVAVPVKAFPDHPAAPSAERRSSTRATTASSVTGTPVWGTPKVALARAATGHDR